MTIKKSGTYPKLEEFLNIISHGIGLVLALIATFFLIKKASLSNTDYVIFSVIAYGLGMITLYAASTLYHYSTNPYYRKKLQILDHSSIYLLIAGTYTPFALLALGGTTGWVIFWVTWTLAITGIIVKLFFTGRFNLISTIMYVVMGWSIIPVIFPLIDAISLNGFWCLLAGGISYSIGAIFFMLDSLKFNHAIFHVLVLFGTALQFISVYFYVLN